MINEKSEITEELISRVESVLQNSAASERTIKHYQIKAEIKEEINGVLWQDILDPIYQRSWERDHFDLTLVAPIQIRSATVQHRRHGGVNGRGKGRGQGL